MKKLVMLATAMALIADVAMAQTAAKKPAAAPAAQAKTHEVNAEFVSADAAAKKVTLKDDKGQSMTIAAEAAAMTDAKALKAGDKVTASCRDSASGQHEAVTHIKKAKM